MSAGDTWNVEIDILVYEKKSDKFWFISLIRSIEMLCNRISLTCDEVYWTLQM